jgi:hypothetical protein
MNPENFRLYTRHEIVFFCQQYRYRRPTTGFIAHFVKKIPE